MWFSLIDDTRPPRDGFRPDDDGQGPTDPAKVPGTGILGMVVLLASLSFLFIASLVGFAIIRLRQPVWPPEGMSSVPDLMWVSTALILVSSLTMQLCIHAARSHNALVLRSGILATSLLALAFLIMQVICWVEFLPAARGSKELYVFLFYFMTALHWAHVIGGVGPMAYLTHKAFIRSGPELPNKGILYIGLYWHFLDVVWLILFAVIFLDVLQPLVPFYERIQSSPIERQGF